VKIFIGTDHNGFHMRNVIVSYLTRAGYEVEDEGDSKLDPEDDFPIFASKVVKDILGSEDADARGILLCGSGQGMCMAANRYRGIRACLGYDQQSIRASRNDDNANVLCLPALTLDKDQINVLVEIFLNTKFAGAPRFSRRIQQLDDM
jgi:ribose 5-phosphate isomerase B